MTNIFDEASRRADADRRKREAFQEAFQSANEEILMLARAKIRTLNCQIPELYDHLRRLGISFDLTMVEPRERRPLFKAPEIHQVPVSRGWCLISNSMKAPRGAQLSFFAGLILLESGTVYEYTGDRIYRHEESTPWVGRLVSLYDINKDSPPGYVDSSEADDSLMRPSVAWYESKGLGSSRSPGYMEKVSGAETYSHMFAEIISKYVRAIGGSDWIVPVAGLRVHAWADQFEESLVNLAGLRR